MRLVDAKNKDIKKAASQLGYELSDQDCETMRTTSPDPRETVDEAVDDFLRAYE